MSNGEIKKRRSKKSGESIASEENDPLVRTTNIQDAKVDEDWDLEDDDDWAEGQEQSQDEKLTEEEEAEVVRKRRVLKRDMIELGTGLLYHLLVLCVYIGIHVYDATIVKRNDGKGFDGLQTYGGRWKYLTYCNLWFLFLYFFFSFFTDIMPWSDAKYWCLKTCDVLFTTVAAPLTLFVMFMFWGIYLLDREMVYPKELDKYIPSLLNHCWHTIPTFFIFFENVFVFHRYPGNMRAVQFLFVVSTLYIVWIVWVFTSANIWPYPFFKLIPLPAFPVFFSVMFLISIFFYFVGKFFCYFRWRERHDLMDEMGL